MKLLIGGSPCTHWSIAQTKNRETQPEGIGWELFENYLIARKKFQPDYFLYENNKSMAAPIREQITRELGVEPILINSTLVSAQNRQRLYWTNIPGVKQPEDRGIVLRDILDTGLPLQDKSFTLKANYSKVSAANAIDDGHFPAPMAAEPVNTTVDGKAQCLRASYYKDGIRNMVGNTVDRRTCVAIPVISIDNYRFVPGEVTERTGNQFLGGLEKEEGKRWLANGKNYSRNFNQGRRLFGIDGKTPTVTAQGFGLAGHAGLYAVPAEIGSGHLGSLKGDENGYVFEAENGKKYPVYEVQNGQIFIKGESYPIKLADGLYIIRKLTVRECMRLQTIPEDYIFPVSDTQAYKMIGNGWTVDVITHILSHCPDICSDPLTVLSMYDGMSCGRLALKKLGAQIDRYYACEIDKYAIQTTQLNFPDTIQLGDAFQVRDTAWTLPAP